RPIDLVRAESRLVLLEPEAAQPSHYLHLCHPSHRSLEGPCQAIAVPPTNAAAKLAAPVVFGHADGQTLPWRVAHLAEELHVGRHKGRLFRLGESDMKAVADRMIELAGDGDGPRR